MATQLETTAPPVKSSITDSFRQAADPQNTTGRNPSRVAPPSNPPAKEESAIPEKKAPAEEIKAPAESPVGDPDAGLKTAAKPNDKETNLRALAKKAEDAEKRAQDLETRLRETEARIPQDYDQVKKDREDLMTALERTNIEESPRFKEKYDKPQQTLITQIKKTLLTTEANPDEIAALVAMPESKERTKALNEALEGLDRISQGRVAAAVSDFDSIRDARAAELGSPRETFQKMRQDQENASRTQRENNAKVMDNTIQKARTAFPWFKEIDGNDAWNAKVSEVQSLAKSYWNDSHTPEQLAEVTIAGVMAPMFTKALELARAENEKLNAELAQYRDATPGTKVGSGGNTDEKGVPKESMLDAVHRGMGTPTRGRR